MWEYTAIQAASATGVKGYSYVSQDCECKMLSDHLLWGEFRDGSESIYDAGELVEKYAPFQELLNDFALFSSVKVDAGGYGISWNNDLDLSAEELWNNGRRLKESTFLSPGCCCPTCGQKIRRKSPAQIAASRANLGPPP